MAPKMQQLFDEAHAKVQREQLQQQAAGRQSGRLANSMAVEVSWAWVWARGC